MSNFKGFAPPSANYSKLPHEFINLLPEINSMAELKVVIYILRHTWGFSEYDKPKRITTDEFMNGRKRKDGTRLDNGTGLSNKSVISGLESAVEHGFVFVEKDETDKARIEKSYLLNICGMEDLHTEQEVLHSSCVESKQRSEKETKKETKKEERDTTPDFSNMTVSQAYKIPALKLYKKATGIFPGNGVWEYVHNFITANSLTEKQIREASIIWCARGYNRYNVEGVLEWAKNGVPQNGNGHRKQKQSTTPEPKQVTPEEQAELKRKAEEHFRRIGAIR